MATPAGSTCCAPPGAEQAKLLLVAIDDRDKTSELVETAHEAFPNLKIIARAWDRRHAYDLLRSGADEVERETFESALMAGVETLKPWACRPRAPSGPPTCSAPTT